MLLDLAAGISRVLICSETLGMSQKVSISEIEKLLFAGIWAKDNILVEYSSCSALFLYSETNMVLGLAWKIVPFQLQYAT